MGKWWRHPEELRFLIGATLVVVAIAWSLRSQFSSTSLTFFAGVGIGVIAIAMMVKVRRYVHKVSLTDDLLVLSAGGREASLTSEDVLKLHIHLDYRNPIARIVDFNGKTWVVAFSAFVDSGKLISEIRHWWEPHRVQKTVLGTGQVRKFHQRTVGFLFLSLGTIGVSISVILLARDFASLKEALTLVVLTSPMWFLANLMLRFYVEVSGDGVATWSGGKKTEVKWHEIEALMLTNVGNEAAESIWISWQEHKYSMGLVDDRGELRDLLMAHLSPEQIVDNRRWNH